MASPRHFTRPALRQALLSPYTEPIPAKPAHALPGSPVKSNALIPPQRLIDTLQSARRNSTVVAGLLTSPRCPWCIALIKEQLEPRVRSDQMPRLLIVEFNVDDPAEFLLPGGQRSNARQWGDTYGLKLTPTVAMLDQMARPLLAPLKGYASRDFYGAYLEEQITTANNYWQNLRS